MEFNENKNFSDKKLFSKFFVLSVFFDNKFFQEIYSLLNFQIELVLKK